MVQRAPSAVHLCCTYGTRRTIPIKLNRSMAPVPGVVHLWFAALYTSPLQLPICKHWWERHLNLNVKKNELCQTLSEEASQSDPHSDALYSQSLLLMSHLIPLFTHLKVMHRGRWEKEEKGWSPNAMCDVVSCLSLGNTSHPHVLAWSIRTNLELLAFKRSLWSQIVVTCSVVEVGNDDNDNFKADDT